jgi:hypothetical protein
MPYEINRLPDGAFQVRNKETGNVHAKHTTLAKAKAQIAALHAAEKSPPKTTREVAGREPETRKAKKRRKRGK